MVEVGCAARYQILGALSESGLKGQVLVARLRNVNTEKLRNAIGTRKSYVDTALALADRLPQQAMDLAVPEIKRQLFDIGIDADVSVAAASPPPRPKSEFFPGAAAGAVGMAVLGGLVYGAWRLVR